MALHLFRLPLVILCILHCVISASLTSDAVNNAHDSPNLARDFPTTTPRKDYCIIGAGPSGLQMGYFLQRANRDYIIFERANTSGAFFVKYPRHRKLISINKFHTGKTNKEFNLRHDWNSLISDDNSLQMKLYSKEFFPDADDYVRYLSDYAKKLNINIQYNTNIGNIQRVASDEDMTEHFIMDDQSRNSYICRYLIVCTGLAQTNNPPIIGEEYTESYEDMPLDTNDYNGKTVLILGNGNSAFETADHIMGVTNLIHVVGRDRVRLAWETHYVGDLRAINNGLLDTYMLKSLDGVIEGGDVSNFMVVKRNDGKLVLGLADPEDDHVDIFDLWPKLPDNFSLRNPYDKIIKCLGFKFDFDLFDSQIVKIFHTPRRSRTHSAVSPKYPRIKHDYEAASVPGLFFAGTNTHSLDFRKSAGGFIHGFRYTTRVLHRILEWRYHQVAWPSIRQPITELLNNIIKRLNEASGIYQMFGILVDVIILKNSGTEYVYVEEFPVKLLHQLQEVCGHDASSVFVVSLEYGHDFSGPGKDVFRLDRGTGSGSEAEAANFLHPIIYYYKSLPTSDEMERLQRSNSPDILPEPDDLHHMVDDFLTDFTAPVTHILLLRRFLESCLNQDLRYFFDNECFELSMLHKEATESCKNFYIQGQGLPFYQEIEKAKRRYMKNMKKLSRRMKNYGRKRRKTNK
ncbi:FAD-dependent oxidoreductase domain-containing protein 2-like [Amphiura filiformis]|uniref:FAD-dependent oxidoreductase domain-containing protein 2-like n=1 Tax=Amphiura filiformis TaxID=82378 RepID=UPI003B216E04